MSSLNYPAHIAERQRKAEAALSATGFDGMVIHSGAPMTYYVDDQDAPFRTTPHFAHWCPLDGPSHLLHVHPGTKPRLVRVAPEDYWYEQAPLGEPFWREQFEVFEVTDPERAWKVLRTTPRTAFVGSQTQEAAAHGMAQASLNPASLLAHLDWDRAKKTDYEVDCLVEAAELAGRGHRAAHAAFLEGASELMIHQAYMRAVGCAEKDLPYESIIGLDEKGATLHYTGKRTNGNGRSLLIDVGAQVRRYASDITRTWTSEQADKDFSALVAAMERVQKELCAAVRPSIPYLDLHVSAHAKIGDVLHAAGILRTSGADALERGLTAPFFPHGLGHFLGLQVHDVGGRQRSPEGGTLAPPAQFPYLRTTRKVEEGQVFTIEPGLYFIEMLLRPHRTGPTADAFDWKLVDRLATHGGIRIEDDVLVTKDGHRNLTRPFV